MSAILKVFRYELTRNAKRRGYLFTTFGIPLLLYVVLFGYQFITDMNKSNEPEAPAQLQFDFQGIQKAGYVDPQGVFNDISIDDVQLYESEGEGRAALSGGDIDALYILQPDFLETGATRLVLPEFSLNRLTSDPVIKLMFEQVGQTLDRAKLLRLQTPVVLNEVNLQRADSGSENVVRNLESNMVLVYFFGIAFLLTVFGTSGYLLQSVIEEKENRMVEILITSVRPNQLLSGKVLALGVLGLFQVGVWVAAALYLINTQSSNLTAISALTGLYIPTDSLPLLMVYFVLGYLFFAAIFGGIGAISTSLQEGPQIAVVFTLPAVIPFYLFPLFTTAPNDPLPVFLSMFPVTAPLAMVMRTLVTTVPAWQIALSVVLLALSVVAAFWAAGRLFRVNTLLSGKVPKIRDLPRLIFGKV